MTKNSKHAFFSIAILATLSAVWVAATSDMVQPDKNKLPVTFSGGHDIGKNDFGRPVVLIAATLKVKPDVFREAFSDVTPARGRGPTGDEARRNKDALMRVLAPHKVTNDRLDEVSNYYRFRPQDDELWRNKPAKAYALIENGKIAKIVITQPGAGYSSPPKAKVKGFEKVRLETKIKFDEDLKKNGRVIAVKLASERAAPAKRKPSQDKTPTP